MRQSIWVAATLTTVVLVPGSAQAQEAAGGSFSTSVSSLAVGRRIIVTDAGGNRTTGTILRVSPDALTVGDRTFREADVRRIRTAGDSHLNGLLIGAAVGGGAGAIGSQGLGEYNSDGVGPLILFGIGAGAGVGALVDHLINRPVTLFDSTKNSARLVPLISRTRRGVLVSLSY